MIKCRCSCFSVDIDIVQPSPAIIYFVFFYVRWLRILANQYFHYININVWHLDLFDDGTESRSRTTDNASRVNKYCFWMVRVDLNEYRTAVVYFREPGLRGSWWKFSKYMPHTSMYFALGCRVTQFDWNYYNNTSRIRIHLIDEKPKRIHCNSE